MQLEWGNSLFYCHSQHFIAGQPALLITNYDRFFITNYDEVLTNCDRYYKLRNKLLQITTGHRVPGKPEAIPRNPGSSYDMFHSPFLGKL